MSDGKLALVTGATRGLGHAMAMELGRRGFHIVALGRNQGALEELADALDAQGTANALVPLDICDEGGLQRMCLAIHERWGGLDLLVHCAVHAAPLAPMADIGVKDFTRALEVNVKATQRLAALTEPLVRARKGSMVFMRDDMGGRKFFGTYGSTKAAQAALVESLMAESATVGPRILHLSPNPMPTATRARFFPGEDRSKLANPADEAKRLCDQIFS